jgi:hypothetical protein
MKPPPKPRRPYTPADDEQLIMELTIIYRPNDGRGSRPMKEGLNHVRI